MPLILGTNSIKDTGYDVANSLRFNDGSSDFLSFTQGTATSRKTFSISVWVKRANLSAQQQIFETWLDNNNRTDMQFTASDKILLQQTLSGSTSINIETSRLFRDVSAWYHILAVFNTTESTSSDRVKLYINGVQETSFSPATYPSLNADLALGTSSYTNFLGKYSSSGGNYFDGYMAEYVFTDGTALSNTDVGEFDEDSPTIWKPIDVSGLTFGTNGFYLDFENSGSLGADVSGNSNNFTLNNLTSVDQSTDTCTNNFCTFNSLYNFNVDPTYSEGNCLLTFGGTWGGGKATMAVNKGKWYWEAKLSGTMTNHFHGIQEVNVSGDLTAANPMNLPGGVMFFNQDGGEMRNDGGDTTNDYGTFSDGDIIGIALNMDGGSYGQITIYKNGSAIVSNFDLNSTNDLVAPFTAGGGTMSYNFGGSPSFTISSGNTDGNGYGNFEYAPPSGYYSICTKNLAEFG